MDKMFSDMVAGRECVTGTGRFEPMGAHPNEKCPFAGAPFVSGGDEGARTLGLRLAKPALSQLSYIPM